VLDLEGLASDERYAGNAGRIEHRVELVAALSAITSGWTMGELMARLEPAGVPCGPVNTIDQVFDEPQAKHRGLEITLERPDLTVPTRTVASPIRFSETPVRYDAAPPRLGADTEEVLASISR